MNGAPARALRAGGQRFTLAGAPLLMGIVNATPDSFSDAGELPDVAARVARARRAGRRGRADRRRRRRVGVRRPPAGPRRRGGRAGRAGDRADRGRLDVLVSVDTYKPEVAEAAIAAGAQIVNDVSGLRDPALAERLRGDRRGPRADAHARGAEGHAARPRLLRRRRRRRARLPRRADGAWREAAGMHPEQLLLDPGPDFAKTPAQTVAVLRRLDAAARARPPAAAGGLAQGLPRRDHRPRPARARRRHAGRGRLGRGRRRARACASTTCAPRPTSSPCARCCAASACSRRPRASRRIATRTG